MTIDLVQDVISPSNGQINNLINQVNTALAGKASVAQAAAALTAMPDSTTRIVNVTDATKKLAVSLGGMTAAKTLTIAPLLAADTTLSIQPMVDTTGNLLVQNSTSEQVYIGNNTSIGNSNAGIQYSNATVANRGQIKLHSYFNGAAIAGVSTLTSRSGTVGVNTALVAGQDYSKWTAQAAAGDAGTAPLSGTFAFKANTVNAQTVTSDYHISLTNLAGTLTDALYLGSEGDLTAIGTVKTKNTTNTTAQQWALGDVVTAAAVLDATRYVEVMINGVAVRLAVIQ